MGVLVNESSVRDSKPCLGSVGLPVSFCPGCTIVDERPVLSRPNKTKVRN